MPWPLVGWLQNRQLSYTLYSHSGHGPALTPRVGQEMVQLSSNSLATSCKELIHWRRPWCWERLKVGGEGDDRGWDGWMASPTQWTGVWAGSGSWWWTGRPDVLQSMGSPRVGHDWEIELNWLRETGVRWIKKEFTSQKKFLFICSFMEDRWSCLKGYKMMKMIVV